MVEINPSYLSKDNLKKIKESFINSEFPAVILKDFFNTKSFEELNKKVNSLNFKKEVNLLSHSYSSSDIDINSKEFLDFLSKIFSNKNKFTFKAYKFTWKDYTILNDEFIEKPGMDIIINISDWNPRGGGIINYTDGKGDAYPITAEKNSIAIINRKKGIQKFVQYVNHYGKDRERIFIIGN